jgi:antibiotic biosynthesis monooxygenase (ABM) superfamily enzyme
MPPVPLIARIAITWVAIFPLVVLAQFVTAQLIGGWPGIARTAVTMALVVPVAVTWVMPALMRGYAAVQRRRTARRTR